jgi:hypothetical protein
VWPLGRCAIKRLFHSCIIRFPLQVNTVIIPRACDNYSPNAEGLIFVEFDSVHSARQAASVLNGRKFADKTVVVAFVSDSFIRALHSCRL